MIQPTSQDAYDKIIHELGRRQHDVYTCLLAIEPACNKAIAKELSMPINEITPRVNELRYKGVVEEAYKADYDGRKVIFWQTINPAIKKIIKENPVESLFSEDPLDSFPKLKTVEGKEWKPAAIPWLRDED